MSFWRFHLLGQQIEIQKCNLHSGANKLIVHVMSTRYSNNSLLSFSRSELMLKSTLWTHCKRSGNVCEFGEISPQRSDLLTENVWRRCVFLCVSVFTVSRSICAVLWLSSQKCNYMESRFRSILWGLWTIRMEFIHLIWITSRDNGLWPLHYNVIIFVY